MKQDSTKTIWVGMDVHQASITAAILYGDDPDPEIVRLPGDRRKTDRLDAINLARQYRSGHLVPLVVPTSGEVQRRGAITKNGSGELRRILAEAAWQYRHRSGSTLILQRRRMGQSPQVVAIAVKAQHRLYKKFHRLSAKKHPCAAVTAVARELCGFIWSALWAQQTQEA